MAIVVRRRTILNDASVGGMDDQHVGLGPARDVAGHRAKPLVAARVQSHVANHYQIGLNLLGEAEQRVYRITSNRSRLDILRPSRPGPVAGLPQDRIDGGPPMHLVVPLAPEGDLGVGDPGAKIHHTIRPGWSSPASLVSLFHIR